MKNILRAIAEILRAVIDPCGAAKWINGQIALNDGVEQRQTVAEARTENQRQERAF